MARVIGGNQAVRLQSGTTGTSDVLNARLRAAAENVAHPIDTGQVSTTPPPPTDISQVQQTRPLDSTTQGATPDDTRDQAVGGGGGGRQERPLGRIAV